MTKIFVRLVAILLLFGGVTAQAQQTSSAPPDGVAAERYIVECPNYFPDCSKYIVRKLSEAFFQKYPFSDWKIVVAHSLVGRMGNGSLTGRFGIAVVPITGAVSTNDLLTNINSKAPKKVFASSKTGGDIKAMGNPVFDGEMFDNERFKKAALTLLPIMANEAAQSMVDECSKSSECNIYTP
jgi:hypothetical protein